MRIRRMAWSLLAALLLVPTPSSAQGVPVEILTVAQTVNQCHIVNPAPGPGWKLIVYGYYISSPATGTGYLLRSVGTVPSSREARSRAVAVDIGRLHGARPPDRSWVKVTGILACLGAGAAIRASSWKRANSRPPALQVYLSVRPPSALRLHKDATFAVTVRAGPFHVLQAYYVDFHLLGSWATPRVRTPDGSQACGGDNVPQEPALSRGYWHLDFGDCTTIDLVLKPTTVGRHGLTIRLFRVPLSDRGMPQLNRRVEEPGHSYVWTRMVRDTRHA